MCILAFYALLSSDPPNGNPPLSELRRGAILSGVGGYKEWGARNTH
jgi:hypothetical protein